MPQPQAGRPRTVVGPGKTEISWADGSALIDENAHDSDQFLTVVVSPAVHGWTLVFGFWGSLLMLENIVHLADLRVSRTGAGEPFGAERRHLDAGGIIGKPEELDPDSDEATDWLAGTYCFAATEIAAESSLDPTTIGPDAQVSGSMLVALRPSRSRTR